MEKLKVFLIAFGIMFSVLAAAQDAHFSQFYNSPLNLNPALTGMLDGQARLLTNYRNQWFPIHKGDAYNTYSISYDYRLDLNSDNYLGLGLVGNRDSAGEVKFGTSQVNLSCAFAKMISKTASSSHSLIGGLQFGLAKRRIDLVEARWPFSYDPVYHLNPSEFFDVRNNFLNLDLNFGLAWMSRFGARKYMSLGIAAFHANQPNISFIVDGAAVVPLPIKLAVHAEGELPLTQQLSLEPSFIYLNQGVHSQINLGTKLSLSLTSHSFLSNVQGGLFYRASPTTAGIQSDALIMLLAVQFADIQIGFSYDHSISKLSNRLGVNSTLEASIGYLWPSPLN